MLSLDSVAQRDRVELVTLLKKAEPVVLAVVLTVVPAAPAAALECIAIPLETSIQFADIVLLGRIEAVRL